MKTNKMDFNYWRIEYQEKTLTLNSSNARALVILELNSNVLQVKIWFQNHRYKCKKSNKDKINPSMAQFEAHSYCGPPNPYQTMLASQFNTASSAHSANFLMQQRQLAAAAAAQMSPNFNKNSSHAAVAEMLRQHPMGIATNRNQYALNWINAHTLASAVNNSPKLGSLWMQHVLQQTTHPSVSQMTQLACLMSANAQNNLTSHQNDNNSSVNIQGCRIAKKSLSEDMIAAQNSLNMMSNKRFATGMVAAVGGIDKKQEDPNNRSNTSLTANTPTTPKDYTRKTLEQENKI